jgi:hypothetical protein
MMNCMAYMEHFIRWVASGFSASLYLKDTRAAIAKEIGSNLLASNQIACQYMVRASDITAGCTNNSGDYNNVIYIQQDIRQPSASERFRSHQIIARALAERNLGEDLDFCFGLSGFSQKFGLWTV